MRTHIHIFYDGHEAANISYENGKFNFLYFDSVLFSPRTTCIYHISLEDDSQNKFEAAYGSMNYNAEKELFEGINGNKCIITITDSGNVTIDEKTIHSLPRTRFEC